MLKLQMHKLHRSDADIDKTLLTFPLTLQSVVTEFLCQMWFENRALFTTFLLSAHWSNYHCGLAKPIDKSANSG